MSFFKKLFKKKEGGTFVGKLWRGILGVKQKTKSTDSGSLPSDPNEGIDYGDPTVSQRPLIDLGAIFGGKPFDLGNYIKLPTLSVEASQDQNRKLLTYGFIAVCGIVIFKMLNKNKQSNFKRY